MGQKQTIDLRMPVLGKNENWAYSSQPEGTSPDCLNVRPYDVLADRLRGGQRPGTSKFIRTEVNGTAAIQRLGFLITSTSYEESGSLSESFTQANGAFASASWSEFQQLGANYVASASLPIVSSNRILWDGIVGPANTNYVGAINTTPIVGTRYTLTMKVSLGVTGTKDADVSFIWRAPSATLTQATNLSFSAGFRLADTGNYSIQVGTSNTTGTLVASDLNRPWRVLSWWATPRTLKFTVNGNYASLYADDYWLWSATITPLSANKYVGFRARRQTSDSSATTYVTIDDWTATSFTGSDSLSRREPTILAVSDGDIYYSEPPAIFTEATGGDDALVTNTDAVKMTGLLGRMYFVDGTNYKVFNNSTNTVSDWVATSGDLPSGTDQTAVNISAATPATPSFTVATDMSSLAAGDYLLVADSLSNDGIYTVVSAVFSTPNTVITVSEAIPDNNVSGTVQFQNRLCRLIASYRGRIVLSGLVTDPQNWFMTAVDDPLNLDYGATSSATIAVAGNNASSGKCPDIITCLASISDDLLIMGGDHTLWIMRGDPADGGRIDNVSQQTGIAGADAYCFDPNGIFYFFGNGALWRWTQGQVPESLSSDKLSKTFKAINLADNTIKLIWDQTANGVHIYVVPAEEGSTTHYWWDARTESFWPEQYPDVQGPTAVLVYDADSPGDRAVLLGGWDGYIRQEDVTATSDDSTTIHSYVKFAPITPGGVRQNAVINDVTTLLGEDSDAVSLLAYAAESPEKVVVETTPAWSKLVTPTSQYSRPRIGGNSLLFEIENDSFADAWVTATAYVVGSQVISSSTPYVCAEAHTSGTFATDLTAGKWTEATFYTWALESLSAVVNLTGRTRHGRA